MERIYFNLLSNAFKFTYDKGSIVVELDKIASNGEDCALIRVSNSGKGISDEDIKHIFDRFYQVNSNIAGSGIGLALAKAMVEMHQGEITASSAKNGWTTFKVIIPMRKDVQTAVSAPANTGEQTTDSLLPTDDIQQHFVDIPRDSDKPIVLIIDDNSDIRSYAKIILQGKYSVIEAKDGDEGFKMAVRYIPDIIISDVMMPKMDGIELCRKLKSELSTSHIPVILLTACSLDEQRIVGFQSGADDYIAKPFNSDVLEVRIANLIESRKRLKELSGENLFSGNKLTNENTDIDRSFLLKIKELIDKNMADSELNVEDLGQHIGLSRTQLYRKLKSLTNYSPNELLRIMRLKKACHLLSTTETNVSEVTYDVGFTSPSYFAKCFKDYYNESPTDFLKRIR
jgi:DNA-binding response OmpR family regulator